ncbi:MAG: DUF4270 domain-containing protein, partial [Ferruginibacter sp.]|nr:DUF4270 domain-containing protein [Ferruginibacter sp.]
MVFKKKFFNLFLIIFSASLIMCGCNKLDTTTIGTDLVPEVDNINTFADTLEVLSTQGAFEGTYKDTTKLSLTEEYVVGKVNDPLLGETSAALYLQLKPPFYPYYIGKLPKDTIVQADSVVLCLSYKSFWGDSTQPVQLQVFRVSEDAHGEWDSTSSYRNINYAPGLDEALSQPQTIDIRTLKNYVKIGKNDSVNNQIRIKLSDQFRDQLFSRDTTVNRSFRNDTLFRFFNNGFAVVAKSGNSLMYVNLLENTTRLELHYKKKNNSPVDTVYSSFYFNSGLQGEIIRRSSLANNIKRNRNALPSGDQELYLQTTPGTFANVSIPGLSNYSNRVIHRAELQISQIPDPVNDAIYREPGFLYLDLVDTGINKWKPVYFDLNPSSLYDPDFKTIGLPYFPANGNVDIAYYG